MEKNKDIDLTRRKLTSQLIIKRALARGWDVVSFKTNPAVLQLHIPGKNKTVSIFSASPPQMSYAATKITKDKYITSCILRDARLPVPDEVLLDSQDPIERSYLSDFLDKYHKVVVKPLDASHGKGITMNVTDTRMLDSALDTAEGFTKMDSVLVQEQIDGVDIRIVCIDNKFMNAISRVPAYVIGDGRNSIEELITIVNQHPDRSENYKAKLNCIPIDMAREYLGSRRFKRIPAENEEVQVIGVSNVGMGGARINITDNIPEFLKMIAEEASRVLNLPVCGVDFMVRRLPEETSTREELKPRIIEVNECPSLAMYDDLHSPEQNAIIDTYLDYVGGSKVLTNTS